MQYSVKSAVCNLPRLQRQGTVPDGGLVSPINAKDATRLRTTQYVVLDAMMARRLMVHGELPIAPHLTW